MCVNDQEQFNSHKSTQNVWTDNVCIEQTNNIQNVCTEQTNNIENVCIEHTNIIENVLCRNIDNMKM